MTGHERKKVESAILVDEMNIIGQLHSIGVKGINPWNAFYKAVQGYIGLPAEKHFYGANVSKHYQPIRHKKRERFFNSLTKRDINVHEGIAVLDINKKLVEKGVDVMLALDLSIFALDGAKDIVVCSGDTDIVPAIERAQLYGARVHVVVSKNISATKVIDAADVVIQLEDILRCIPPQHILWKDNQQPNFFKESVAI